MDRDDIIREKPTKLIVPLQYMNILKYRPPIRKTRSVRGRRNAINRRESMPLHKLFRA